MTISPTQQVHAVAAYRKMEYNSERDREKAKGKAEGKLDVDNHYNNNPASARRFLDRMNERGTLVDLVA